MSNKYAAINYGSKVIPKSSKYKYVYKVVGNNHKVTKWMARPYGKASKWFDTEREAALFVDRWFIEHGKEPRNILKRI